MGMKILVMFPVRSVADSYSRAIRRLGDQVQTLYSAKDAVDALRATPFDLVITALNDEPVDGLAVVAAARAATPPVEALVMSGLDEKALHAKVLEAGALEHVLLPISLEDLKVRLDRLRSKTAPPPAVAPVTPIEPLVVGISSSALFDLTEADAVFRTQGIAAYRQHMLATENDALAPGTGFPLVRALLALNQHAPDLERPIAEVIVMSRNSPETGLRIMNALEGLGLRVTRFAFTGGEPLADYARAFHLDLFLSTDEQDVQRVANTGACAAAVLYPPPHGYAPPEDQLRVAVDGDAVLFGQDSEAIYQREGLQAFLQNEKDARHEPMADGPFANFLRKLAQVRSLLPQQVEYAPIRIALVTARGAPAQSRVITTLRTWGVYVDQTFFLGGMPKAEVLKALRPHIFFDDQRGHLDPASALVPSGRVPYADGSPLGRERTTAETDGASNVVRLSRSPADS